MIVFFIVGFDTPTECGMYTEKCQVMLGAWALGSPGECQWDDSAFLVGQGSFKKVLLEHHWNNQTQEASY